MDRLQGHLRRYLVGRNLQSIHFTFGLSSKFLIIAVVVSLIGVVISSLLVESLQRNQLIDLAKRTSSRASEIIAVSLEHSMPDQAQMSSQIIQSLVGEGLVERIRVLDPQATVRASSDASEVGLVLDRKAALCQECHAQGEPAGHEMVIKTSESGSPVLLTVTPLHNQPECMGCHDAGIQVLGVSMVEATLTELDNQVAASIDRIVLSGLVTFLLMVSLLALASRVLVTRPIAELAKGILEVGRGNLDKPIRARGNDELGNLAESFNWMRQQLQVARAETAERNRELAVLYQVGAQASASLELSQALDAVAEGARQVLEADIGWVGLVDQGQDQVTVKACSGTRTDLLKGLSLPLVASSEPALQLDILQSLPLDSPWARAIERFKAERIVSSLGVPLRRGERVLGLVGVMTREPRRFTNSDAELLARLAAQVAVAIENAHLYQQARHLAVLEERDRLAREMHDNLSQALGYMNFKTALTTEQLAQGQVCDARSGLEELNQVIQEAYTDVREAIFSLRTTIPFRSGLGAILQEYLADYQAHFGIHTQLILGSEAPADLPEEATVQIVRIIQEAFANIRKHSGASNVTVLFDREDGCVRIAIQDDGRGFDPSTTPGKNGHAFGLDIMSERAKDIGATLELDSRPGHGTRIVVRLSDQAKCKEDHGST